MTRDEAMAVVGDAVRRVRPDDADEVLDTAAQAWHSLSVPKWQRVWTCCVFAGAFLRDGRRYDVYCCGAPEERGRGYHGLSVVAGDDCSFFLRTSLDWVLSRELSDLMMYDLVSSRLPTSKELVAEAVALVRRRQEATW